MLGRVYNYPKSPSTSSEDLSNFIPLTGIPSANQGDSLSNSVSAVNSVTMGGTHFPKSGPFGKPLALANYQSERSGYLTIVRVCHEENEVQVQPAVGKRFNVGWFVGQPAPTSAEIEETIKQVALIHTSAGEKMIVGNVVVVDVVNGAMKCRK